MRVRSLGAAVGSRIVLLALLTGCDRDPQLPPPEKTTPMLVPSQHAGKFSFLALGDSYTIGEGVAATDRWPVQFAVMCRANGLDLADPVILARTGWTTGELTSAMDSSQLENHYDYVALLIGVNNQFRGMPQEQYRSEFKTLLDRSLMFVDKQPKRVIVVSIPDWGVTRFGKGMNALDVSTKSISSTRSTRLSRPKPAVFM